MIQAALIREHYLSGEPTGMWDARTQEAMRRYQGAQSWQTKIVPDSRALIKLGLGPTPTTTSFNQLVGEAHSPVGSGGGAAAGMAQR